MTFQDSRRARFLQEMGVGPLWRLRDRPAPADEADGGGIGAAGTVQPSDAADGDAIARVAPARQENSRAAAIHEPPSPGAMDAKTLPPSPSASDSTSPWEDEVPAWVSEDAPFDDMPFGSPPIDDSMPGKPSAADIARMDWQALESAVSICTKCRLCETRTRTVFGTGDRQAKWLFVGEGPGYNEDQQGEPFVGPAGKLLDNMLAAMGLNRGENAYIANVVKCRPTGDNGKDRPPALDEAAACLPYLERQIALIRPDVIVALGKSAALALLNAAPDTPVSKLRGQVHRHAGVPLIVTYHPAYLLRAPEEKGKAWRDLCMAMSARADAATPR